jgi:nanoRNase/pAp phosphatase (c-di-AMP/oligoRNAs hydrolase)
MSFVSSSLVTNEANKMGGCGHHPAALCHIT